MIVAKAVVAVGAGVILLLEAAIRLLRLRVAWWRHQVRTANRRHDASLEQLRQELVRAYRIRDAAVAAGAPCLIDWAVIRDAEAHLLEMTANRKDPAP